MAKTSQLLLATYFQHCAAHSIHSLLMTDAINRIRELVNSTENAIK